jgi:hypothetical protein
MSLSYHPPRLADLSVHTVAVHQLLVHPILSVPLRHGSKLVGRPPATELVPGLWILH